MLNYRDIQTMDQLNTAIAYNEEIIALREKQVRNRARRARAFYTPSNVLAESFHRLLGQLPFADMALWCIRKLRSIL